MISTELIRVEVESALQLQEWLLSNHHQPNSIWLVTFKKIAVDKYVSREEVLDALVSFGWIDGVRQSLDNSRTMQLISPRKTKPWAKTYKDRAERLIGAGRMHHSGMASVELAKASGDWEAMNSVDMLEIPKDLLQSLTSHGKALEFFEAFPPSSRRNILRWISSAKTEKTRTKRIVETVLEAENNRRVASHS